MHIYVTIHGIVWVYARGLFYGKISGLPGYSGKNRRRYIHRRCRTRPHRKIHIYPQIYGAGRTAGDGTGKTGRGTWSASVKRIRKTDYDSWTEIHTERGSRSAARRWAESPHPSDWLRWISGKRCQRTHRRRKRTNGKDPVVWKSNSVSWGSRDRNT